jgi:hypothetical protein
MLGHKDVESSTLEITCYNLFYFIILFILPILFCYVLYYIVLLCKLLLCKIVGLVYV